MSFTYTPTNRFFVTNPYNPELDRGRTPFTKQQTIDFINSIDPSEHKHYGYILIAEYTIDGKYQYTVHSFAHDIWTPTGKIKRNFVKYLDLTPYIENYIPSNLSETTYENWNAQHANA